jgi:hypothetical protein
MKLQHAEPKTRAIVLVLSVYSTACARQNFKIDKICPVTLEVIIEWKAAAAFRTGQLFLSTPSRY